MLKKTPLHAQHQALGAKLVDFSGWEMPLHYGSQLNEHNFVRERAGMFDVSHMVVVDLHGERSREFLQSVLANDVAKLKEHGKALYSCMCNEQGGVIDDLIVYFMADDHYRLVVNAGTADKDLAWINSRVQSFSVDVKRRADLGILAVQGPKAREITDAMLPQELAAQCANLKKFQACWNKNYFVARTGYTGEDGYELILPHTQLQALWQDLLDAGVAPCGLGARDTLRLEAGMNLYGQDMDETVSPMECGLAWTVAFEPTEREFTGRHILQAHKDNLPRSTVGLVLKDRGVLRSHMVLRSSGGLTGETTSGGFAPTLKQAIAFGRFNGVLADGETVEVDIRGKWLACAVVNPPFVRNGKSLI